MPSQTILEVGAGAGLVGLTLGKLAEYCRKNEGTYTFNPLTIILTDHDQGILRTTNTSLKSQNLNDKVCYNELLLYNYNFLSNI